jgi:hypothetical protein
MVSIYLLVDPRGIKKGYVGKAANPQKRFAQHVGSGARGYCRSWIMSLKKQGLIPTLVVLDIVPDSQWEEQERHWIKYYRELGWVLVNLTEGGEGTSGFSHIVSTETRRKISESNKGKVIAESTRQIWREQRQGQRRGCKHSLETREKMRLAALGRIITPESLEKRRQTIAARGGNPLKGIPRSNEVKQQISASKMGHVVSGEARKHMSEAHKGQQPSPETLRKRSESLKRSWKLNPRRHTDVTKQKMSEARKGQIAWNKGLIMGRDLREKLSAAHKGKKQSEYTKQKRKESLKKYWGAKRYD